MSVRFEAGLTKRLLKELGHLKSHTEQLSGLFFLRNRANVNGILLWLKQTGTCSCELVLKRRRKHVWEELEGDRE